MKTTAFVLLAALWTTASAEELFAQPILDRVERFLRDQAGAPRNTVGPNHPTTEPGYLGLFVDDRQEPRGAVRVVDVALGSAAAQAGLQKGDVITSVDARPVRTTDDLARALEGKPPAARLVITATRDGKSRDYNVTLGRRVAPPASEEREELPQPPATPPRLGIRTLPVTEEVRRQNNLSDTSGALVILVAPGSPADVVGIPLGAVIKAVGDTAVGSPQELAAAMGRVTAPEVELTFVHEGVESRKRVALAAANSFDARNQVRARPIVAPAPSDDPPGEPNAVARIAALEAQVRALEGRIQELEKRLAPAPATDSEKPH